MKLWPPENIFSSTIELALERKFYSYEKGHWLISYFLEKAAIDSNYR